VQEKQEALVRRAAADRTSAWASSQADDDSAMGESISPNNE